MSPTLVAHILSAMTLLHPTVTHRPAAVAGFKFDIGPCYLQYLEPCSDDVIQLYLFTSKRPNRAPILIDARQPELPEWVDLANGRTKVIVHGYGGNLDFYATKAIRDGEWCRFVCDECEMRAVQLIDSGI